MTKKAEIFISKEGGNCKIRVVGRATFSCCATLRNLGKSFSENNLESITVDLSECIGMDSTFMGLLAMLGLKCRKNNAEMRIFNADEENRELLEGLGLSRLFVFVSAKSRKDDNKDNRADDESDMEENAEMVLDAHKTLMNVDGKNVEKFEKVVDMAKRDLDRIKTKKT